MQRQKTCTPESEDVISIYGGEMPWKTYESEGDPLLSWDQSWTLFGYASYLAVYLVRNVEAYQVAGCVTHCSKSTERV